MMFAVIAKYLRGLSWAPLKHTTSAFQTLYVQTSACSSFKSSSFAESQYYWKCLTVLQPQYIQQKSDELHSRRIELHRSQLQIMFCNFFNEKRPVSWDTNSLRNGCSIFYKTLFSYDTGEEYALSSVQNFLCNRENSHQSLGWRIVYSKQSLPGMRSCLKQVMSVVPLLKNRCVIV